MLTMNQVHNRNMIQNLMRCTKEQQKEVSACSDVENNSGSAKLHLGHSCPVWAWNRFVYGADS